MNFLDTYDIAGQSATSQRAEQSLNDEVSEVMGQLGRFWGGFKKQATRKDLSGVVTQAQKELTKLTSIPAVQPASTSPAAAQAINTDPDATTTRETEDEPILSASEETSAASTSTSSLVSRFQSALPPNLLDTVRNQIPESIKHASGNIDLPQLRANFLTEFQRVQGITRVQAEEYAHKSEALFREAIKEASVVLRDAVKILPPEEAGMTGEPSGNSGGLIWDGSDMWSLPLEPSDTMPSTNTSRRADAQEAVATRAETLFRLLRHDPAILKRDPAVDGGELYSSWVASEIDSQEGGILGKYWADEIEKVLVEAGADGALKKTKDVLVPSELNEGEFWTRYFFRAHQIRSEEQKRKELLKGTLDEVDFSWEDDDEEAGTLESPPTTTAHELSTPSPSHPTVKETLDERGNKPDVVSAASSSVAQDSSEEYDLVSSGYVSPKEARKAAAVPPGESKDSSDGDSDWE
ncbi:hypothetical protein C0993_000705 [Termitomyces sp. T159_Od127]|nr:hypothetical protein C0993_000705 [Termitomyces sp. T159_Od127]